MTLSMPLTWPEVPTCHGGAPNVAGGARWREPFADLGWRTCWYCGSIHPQDLYRHLTETPGVTLGGSDWKYGWPHKFYVEGLPNGQSGELVEYSGLSMGQRPTLDRLGGEFRREESTEREATDEELFAAGWRIKTTRTIELHRDADGEREVRRYDLAMFQLPRRKVAPATWQGKWYNEHLQELLEHDRRSFDALAEVLSLRSGITWTADRRDGKWVVMYRAPYHGYQASRV